MEMIREAMSAGWNAFQAGNLGGAEQVYRLVVGTDPSNAQAWYMLGSIKHLRGRNDEAVTDYLEAIRLVPNFSEASNNLGAALHAERRFAEAEASLRRALSHQPNYAEAHNNLGATLHAQGRSEEAEASLRLALSHKPNYAEAHNNLGNVLQERGELDEALECYRQAVRLEPEYTEACNNLGNTLLSQGRMAEAMGSYNQALKRNPEHAEVHLNRALTWLGMGDFAKGWPEYEWRLKVPQYSVPSFRQPLWDGSPLDGRTILLHADHGLGDAIQFIRYVPLVRQRGGRVILQCCGPLARLLATSPGIERVVVIGDDVPDSDVYAPLMSLPGIFGTTLETISADVPYLFPEESLVERWRGELAPTHELRVGIAWQGNPQHTRDRSRSFRLSQFEAISRPPGLRLFSLQKFHGSEQLGDIEGRFAVTDLGIRLDDMMDTAAVMENLDLVIVADSALAHLAGALGVPVWVALPFAPDWRWLRGRDDSPWHPTMRLFRQRRLGDWDEVFERIAAELESDWSRRGFGRSSEERE